MILSLFSATSAAALASPFTLICSWFGSDCVWLSSLSFPFLKAVTVVPLLHLGTIKLSQKITEMHGFALKIWADLKGWCCFTENAVMTWHSRPFRVFFSSYLSFLLPVSLRFQADSVLRCLQGLTDPSQKGRAHAACLLSLTECISLLVSIFGSAASFPVKQAFSGMSLNKHSRRIGCVRQKKAGKLRSVSAVKQAYHFSTNTAL